MYRTSTGCRHSLDHSGGVKDLANQLHRVGAPSGVLEKLCPQTRQLIPARRVGDRHPRTDDSAPRAHRQQSTAPSSPRDQTSERAHPAPQSSRRRREAPPIFIMPQAGNAGRPSLPSPHARVVPRSFDDVARSLRTRSVIFGVSCRCANEAPVGRVVLPQTSRCHRSLVADSSCHRRVVCDSALRCLVGLGGRS